LALIGPSTAACSNGSGLEAAAISAGTAHGGSLARISTAADVLITQQQIQSDAFNTNSRRW
jgi:hypothetical protein